MFSRLLVFLALCSLSLFASAPTLPLLILPNAGQAPPDVLYTARASDVAANFLPGEVDLAWHGVSLRIRPLHANSDARIEGLEKQPGKASFLLGKDSSRWVKDLNSYRRVAYRQVYPGIDMIYGAAARLLKSEFVVAPGADYRKILVEYGGAEGIRVDDNGALVISTASGDLREDAPEIYQEIDGRRVAVAGRYRLLPDNRVGFELAAYDHSRTLVIDPAIRYSTYFGGRSLENATAVAVDAAGNAYITGWTDSPDFPTNTGQNTSGGSVDAFVAKFSPTGTLIYSTYFGGNGDDRAFGLAVDSLGQAHITGWTYSTNLPVTSAYQSVVAGGRDAFAAKLNASGSGFVYCTYLGGAGYEQGNGIALDPQGNAYIVGNTTSTNFPTRSAYQSSNRGQNDLFVVKLGPLGSLLYSTYLGGNGDDMGNAIAVDASGNAYVTGSTLSSNFPTVNPFQASGGGGQDALVAKLSPAGSALVYSSYLGGSGGSVGLPEIGNAIAVDTAGNAYIAGNTSSLNFPLNTPFQASSPGGGVDGFLTKVSPFGNTLLYSTYLGGSSVDSADAIAVDAAGNAYVAGYTASPDFPTVGPIQPNPIGSYDAYVVQFNAAGSALVFGTYLGGSGIDAVSAVAVDSAGNIYLAGQTQSPDFPVFNAVSTINAGNYSAFLTKLGPGSPAPSAVSVTPAAGAGASVNLSALFSDPAGAANLSWAQVLINSAVDGSRACFVHYDRVRNLLFLIGDDGASSTNLTPGSTGVLINSQCSLAGATSSAAASGTDLTLLLAITFKPAFTGLRNVYMATQNSFGLASGMQARGVWTPFPLSVAPTAVSVSPASGSGYTQTFTMQFSDPNGYSDINFAEIGINAALNGVNACFVLYERASNRLYLINDASTGSSSQTIGAAGTLQNSQCSVDTAGSSASGAGQILTLNLALTFKPAFSGSRTIYLLCQNKAGLTNGWQAKGVWTVGGGAATPVSVSPASGAGQAQTFQLSYTDPAGFADIALAQFGVNAALDASRACFVLYERAANLLYLFNDAASAATTAAMGSSAVLQNSQCSIDAAGSSVATSGATLTLTLAVTFKTAFTGVKNIYSLAQNSAGVNSGWQTQGTWNITAASSQGVSPASVTPSAGAGSAQTFSFLFTDTSGASDIALAQVGVNAVLDGSNACFVLYERARNLLYLINDASTGAMTQTLGTVGVLQNSQCMLDTGASSVTTSGNSLTLNLALTFKSPFAGAKNIYLSGQTNSGQVTSWQLRGAWTVR